MEHGKFLFLLFCIIFFVFFSCVKDGIIGRPCFISADSGTQTAMVCLDKRANRGSTVRSDQKFMLSSSSTASKSCRFISGAGHPDLFEPPLFKGIVCAVVIMILKEPIISRHSYLLEIRRHLQPQVHSFFFLRILDCLRLTNRLQKCLFVGGGR